MGRKAYPRRLRPISWKRALVVLTAAFVALALAAPATPLLKSRSRPRAPRSRASRAARPGRSSSTSPRTRYVYRKNQPVAAEAGLEREAPGRRDGALDPRPGLHDPHRVLRKQGYQTGTVWHGQADPQGLRRSGAVPGRSSAGWPARWMDAGITRVTGAHRRRRDLLRQGPGRPRLEGVLLQGRMPAALGAHREPRPLQGPHREPARPRCREDAAVEARRARASKSDGRAKLGRAGPSSALDRNGAVPRSCAGSCARWTARATTSTPRR